MKYIVIATIDDKNFKTIEVDSNNTSDVEAYVLCYMRHKYVGNINIIRIVEKTVWQKLLKEVG